jgi:hypothetical protein
MRGDAYPCCTETQVIKGTFVRTEADGSVSANVEIKRSLFKVDVTGKCVYPKPQALAPKLGRDVSTCFTEVRTPSLNPEHWTLIQVDMSQRGANSELCSAYEYPKTPALQG